MLVMFANAWYCAAGVAVAELSSTTVAVCVVYAPPLVGVASRTVFRVAAVDSPPQYKPAKATLAPTGKLSAARDELKVLASLSTSMLTMVWMLLVRLADPVFCASVQLVPAPVVPATWLQVVLALAAMVMSPAAFSVKRGAKVRTTASAGALHAKAPIVRTANNRPEKYR